MQPDSVLNVTPNNNTVSTDTVTSTIQTMQAKTAPSTFVTESRNKNMEVIPKMSYNGDWITASFLIALILLATSNFLYRKRIRDLFKAFWARNYSNQFMRKGNIFKEQSGFLLSLIFLISTSLFFLLAINYFLPNCRLNFSFLALLQIAAFLLILWTIRIIFVKLTAILFKTYKPSSEVLTQIFIFNLISGVVVLPFSILFYYSEILGFLFSGMIIWGFIQIYRFLRLFTVGLSYSIFSGLHLFLYLCTLEILPIVILLKIASNIYL